LSNYQQLDTKKTISVQKHLLETGLNRDTIPSQKQKKKEEAKALLCFEGDLGPHSFHEAELRGFAQLT
jgi:hypothetical protein